MNLSFPPNSILNVLSRKELAQKVVGHLRSQLTEKLNEAVDAGKGLAPSDVKQILSESGIIGIVQNQFKGLDPDTMSQLVLHEFRAQRNLMQNDRNFALTVTSSAIASASSSQMRLAASLELVESVLNGDYQHFVDEAKNSLNIPKGSDLPRSANIEEIFKIVHSSMKPGDKEKIIAAARRLSELKIPRTIEDVKEPGFQFPISTTSDVLSRYTQNSVSESAADLQSEHVDFSDPTLHAEMCEAEVIGQWVFEWHKSFYEELVQPVNDLFKHKAEVKLGADDDSPVLKVSCRNRTINDPEDARWGTSQENPLDVDLILPEKHSGFEKGYFWHIPVSLDALPEGLVRALHEKCQPDIAGSTINLPDGTKVGLANNTDTSELVAVFEIEADRFKNENTEKLQVAINKLSHEEFADFVCHFLENTDFPGKEQLGKVDSKKIKAIFAELKDKEVSIPQLIKKLKDNGIELPLFLPLGALAYADKIESPADLLKVLAKSGSGGAADMFSQVKDSIPKDVADAIDSVFPGFKKNLGLDGKESKSKGDGKGKAIDKKSILLPLLLGAGGALAAIGGFFINEDKVKSSTGALGSFGLGAVLTALIRRANTEGEKVQGHLNNFGGWAIGAVSAALSLFGIGSSENKPSSAFYSLGTAVLGGVLSYSIDDLCGVLGFPLEQVEKPAAKTDTGKDKAKAEEKKPEDKKTEDKKDK